jgi:hypothetical protein
MGDARRNEAIELMTRFAERTGLTSRPLTPSRRYLWTDAFAVCNFLGLAHATGDSSYEELAIRLIDRVHRELGRHRTDERSRTGWISGLAEDEGRTHPTRGGLRIGKPLPERATTEPLDSDLEWHRDGQYFHYLTKWMHALDQAARCTGRLDLSVWARELAETAYGAFTEGAPGRRRMAWKLSIDLSRALVPSMGQHDPLDGFVTCKQLEATAAAMEQAVGPMLESATAGFAEMLVRCQLVTTDPLGLGGLLTDACRLAQLDVAPDLVSKLLQASVLGLRRYVMEPDLGAPADVRLAFRELGLAIGLAGVATLEATMTSRRVDDLGRASLAELVEQASLRSKIESYWLSPFHRRSPTWAEHEDINDVMLATSLAPEGFLALLPPHPRAASRTTCAVEGAR